MPHRLFALALLSAAALALGGCAPHKSSDAGAEVRTRRTASSPPITTGMPTPPRLMTRPIMSGSTMAPPTPSDPPPTKPQ